MKLDPSTRELIDDAVAAGRVRKITPETSERERIEGRRETVRRYHDCGMTVKLMAQKLACSVPTIYNDLEALGLKVARRREPEGSGDQAAAQKAERASAGAAKVRDRRRFKHVPVPMGEPSRMADADAVGTVFPDRVFTADGSETVLKDGCNNSKIGGDVLVGHLAGAYIATLTLEERATCPRSCAMWRGCYGNSMQHSRRWRPGPELEGQLRDEVEMACQENDRVLIRLHVLGDFYSFDYLKVWAWLLDEHPNLHVFGFTAWAPDTRIGAGVARLRGVYPDRFMIRHSGRTGAWGSFTLPFPTDAKTIGDAIVCPEQLDAMRGSPRGRHCGNCGVCWSTDRPVAFVEH